MKTYLGSNLFAENNRFCTVLAIVITIAFAHTRSHFSQSNRVRNNKNLRDGTARCADEISL